MIDIPAKILDGLINTQEILPPRIGSEAIVLYLQPAQHPHLGFS
jgi:hypothetical protein